MTQMEMAADLERAIRAIGLHFGASSPEAVGNHVALRSHVDEPRMQLPSGMTVAVRGPTILLGGCSVAYTHPALPTKR